MNWKCAPCWSVYTSFFFFWSQLWAIQRSGREWGGDESVSNIKYKYSNSGEFHSLSAQGFVDSPSILSAAASPPGDVS